MNGRLATRIRPAFLAFLVTGAAVSAAERPAEPGAIQDQPGRGAASPAGVPGPIRVSGDGRYFVDREGRPFFWLGDTAWPLFAQYTRDEAEAYLAHRSQKGFTVIQGVLAWGLGSGFEGKVPLANANGDKPWLNDDPRTPNDAYYPRKPVVLGEGAYENGPEYPQGPITPLIVRRQAWWTVMAGGFPTYGQDQMWRMAAGWDKTFDTPGAAHVAKMKEIVMALPWWEMTADQGLFATGVGSERTFNTALRSSRGDKALLYIASQCTFTLHLDKIAAQNVRVTWIDPKTGERRDAGSFPTGNLNGKQFPEARTQAFSVPGHWEDAALLLEAAP